MSVVDEMFRELWKRFGPSMTRSAIYVDGKTREMTAEEMRMFGEAFENARQKPE